MHYSPTEVVEATALLFVQHVKGAIIVDHVTPPHGKKMTSPERIATVACWQQLPVEASFQANSELGSIECRSDILTAQNRTWSVTWIN